LDVYSKYEYNIFTYVQICNAVKLDWGLHIVCWHLPLCSCYHDYCHSQCWYCGQNNDTDYEVLYSTLLHVNYLNSSGNAEITHHYAN